MKWEVREFYGGAFDKDWVEVVRLTGADAPGFDPNFEIPEGADEYVDPESEEYYEVIKDMIQQWLVDKLACEDYEWSRDLSRAIDEFAEKAAEWYPWHVIEVALGYVKDEEVGK